MNFIKSPDIDESQKHYAKRSQIQMTSYYMIVFTRNFRGKLVMKSKSVWARGGEMGSNMKGKEFQMFRLMQLTFFGKKLRMLIKIFFYHNNKFIFPYSRGFFLGGGGRKSFKISNIDHLRFHINLYSKKQT